MIAQETVRITVNHQNPLKKQRVNTESIRFELVLLCLRVCCWVFYNSLICCSDNNKSQRNVHLSSLSLAPDGVCVMAILVWLVWFQTLSEPQLGERDSLFLVVTLQISVTFTVFADAANFCLCWYPRAAEARLDFEANKNLSWMNG